jgi:hypothetical protein
VSALSGYFVTDRLFGNKQSGALCVSERNFQCCGWGTLCCWTIFRAALMLPVSCILPFVIEFLWNSVLVKSVSGRCCWCPSRDSCNVFSPSASNARVDGFVLVLRLFLLCVYDFCRFHPLYRPQSLYLIFSPPVKLASAPHPKSLDVYKKLLWELSDYQENNTNTPTRFYPARDCMHDITATNVHKSPPAGEELGQHNIEKHQQTSPYPSKGCYVQYSNSEDL